MMCKCFFFLSSLSFVKLKNKKYGFNNLDKGWYLLKITWINLEKMLKVANLQVISNLESLIETKLISFNKILHQTILKCIYKKELIN